MSGYFTINSSYFSQFDYSSNYSEEKRAFVSEIKEGNLDIAFNRITNLSKVRQIALFNGAESEIMNLIVKERPRAMELFDHMSTLDSEVQKTILCFQNKCCPKQVQRTPLHLSLYLEDSEMAKKILNLIQNLEPDHQVEVLSCRSNQSQVYGWISPLEQAIVWDQIGIADLIKEIIEKLPLESQKQILDPGAIVNTKKIST